MIHTVRLSQEYIALAHTLACNRLKHFKNVNEMAQLIGACGEFGVCTWLEENGITIERKGAHAAFSFKNEQKDADIIIAFKLRIEIKTNDSGNPRYRVKTEDEKQIVAKADVMLWCEAEPELKPEDRKFGATGWDVAEPPKPLKCDVTILGWATTADAFAAPFKDGDRFMAEKDVQPVDDLLAKIRGHLTNSI